MKKTIIVLFIAINSPLLFGQTILTIEGINTVNTATGEWLGVNIPRNTPTTFTYRNNSITSANSSGYMLQAGDEGIGSNNNFLDGEVITGNRFIWNGTDIATTITHSVFTGYNINSIIKYNYLSRVPMGIILKSNGMVNTSGGVAYNIINKSGNIAVAIKGMKGVQVYNNTFYSDEVRWTNNLNPGTDYGIVDIFANDGVSPWAYPTGTKIKNNIFYTVNQIFNISIQDAQDLTGFESDYNVFYCEAGTPLFKYLGASKTFSQWQALGYDTHSIVINPNFNNFTDFVPAIPLNYGTDLGTTWQAGLSTTAIWTIGLSPTTANQSSTWQVGARINYSPVTHISVTAVGGSNNITTLNGTLQLSAEVLPLYAYDKTVTWSIINGTGLATISPSGLVTAVNDGTVTARATANDGSGVYGTLTITNSSQIVPVTGITLTGAGGATVITTDNGTLQLNAAVLPANSTNKTVTWSIINGTGYAIINSTGRVTAVENGTVTARATAIDGSGVFGTLIISISNQLARVTGITVYGAGGLTTISSDNGTLQLIATILPVDATNKTVTWSIVNETGQATINDTGLVTSADNGTVTARATANDGSGVYGTLTITISNQIVPVTGITLTGAGGATTITTDNGTLQLSVAVLPANATNKTVTWSLVNGTGVVTISASGLVTAAENGTVTVRAAANDGSGVFGTLIITVSNQIIPVTGITITGANESTTITTEDGTLQLSASVHPVNATDKSVTWSISNNTGHATINSTGLVTAVDNGTVTAIATANGASSVFGILVITISNQIIPVTNISVTGAGGSTTITTENGTLQLGAAILPVNATINDITWSLVNGTGQATISASGIVTASGNGTVTARARANDGTGIYGTLVITISNQQIHVNSISITADGGTNIITSTNIELQLNALVLPSDAADKSVTWLVINGTGEATISDLGLVTALAEGTITVIATAKDNSGIYGTLEITISDLGRSVTGENEQMKIIVTSYEMKILLFENGFSWKADLYNLKGSLVMSRQLERETVSFDVSSLPSGIYIVVLSNGEKLKAAKVIKP